MEQSRNKKALFTTIPPFQNLGCHVSRYCLTLLCEELARGEEWTQGEAERLCKCAKRTTHGLPCACELKQISDEGGAISVNRIHPFWRTLVINANEVQQPCSSQFTSEDHRLFQTLADEVKQKKPQLVRTVSQAIRNVLHPESSNYGEPEVKDNSKGRPKGSKSTARHPSAWEYITKHISRRSNSSLNKTSDGRKSFSSVNGKSLT